jgi:serine protease Do
MTFAKPFLSVSVAVAILAAGLFLSPALVQPSLAAPSPAAQQEPKDLAGFQALQTQIQAVVHKVLPAVVGIQIGSSAGSGVIVSEDGIVMTAGHVVVKPGQKVTFFMPDGKAVPGITLGLSAGADAGLMKIVQPGKWPFVPLGDSASLKPGMWCLAIGHPLGYRPGRPPVVRVGRILQKSENMIQTDCPLVGGDSGGPLVDLEGKVIGINSRIAGPTDVNLHVPVNIFREMWDEMLKSQAVQPVLPGRNGPDVKTPFRQVVQAANQCVVRIKCDGQDVALGTIVGPDGWILTKASEILAPGPEIKPRGRLTCRLRDGRELEAQIKGAHAGLYPGLDLAMLKIDAVNLPIIPWNPLQPTVGQWLASAGMEDDPLAVGIVSVPRRSIPPIGGVMGILLAEKEGEATIEKVMPKSPADRAGLKPNDVVTQVNGQTAPNVVEVRNLLRRHKPGAVVHITVKRGQQTLEFVIKLIKFSSPGLDRQTQMNAMGVGVSGRSDNFPAVLQHDTVVRPVDCGGPVVDLSGKIVGVNISHAGRTETYCLPTDVVLASMYELMSGRLSPSVLEAARKAAAEREAAEEKAAEEKAAAEAKAAAEKAAAEKKAADEKAAAAKKAAEEKAAAEKKAAEEKAAAAKKAAEEKAAAEKKAAEARAAAAKAAEEKAAAAKKAADEKAAAEKKAADAKAAAEKAAAEKAAAAKKAAEEKAAAEKKAADEKTAAEKKAAEKAAAEKAAAAKKADDEKAAKEKKEAEKKRSDKKQKGPK